MQIFNIDETGVSVVHKLVKVVAEVGQRVWHQQKEGKITLSYMYICKRICVASLFNTVYPSKRVVPENFRYGAIPGTLFKNTENGWINQEIYME